MGDRAESLAFSPGSITCFFYIERGSSPRSTFSRGCAINIAEGVSAAIVESDQAGLFLNGRPIQLPPVQAVVEQLAPRPIELHLSTPLPIGCGFGVSAAGTLAAAFAMDSYFALGHPRRHLGLMAHVAEVESRTGIGDVAAQLCGGIVYRRCQSDPFDCERLDVAPVPLCYRVFGPLSTSEVLRSEQTVAAIARQGPLACRWIELQKPSSVAAILKRSREFVEASGLLTEQVRDTIQEVVAQGGEASMILLGQSVIASGADVCESPLWTSTSVDCLGTRILN